MLVSALLAATVAFAPAQGSPQSPSSWDDRVQAALAPQAGGLTSDEVASRAVASSPDVEVRRAEMQAVAARVDRTIAAFAPDVTAQAMYRRISPTEFNFGGDGASVVAQNEGPIVVDPGTGAVIDSMGAPVFAVPFEPIENPLNQYSLTASLTVPFMDYALRLVPARRGSRAEARAAREQRDAQKLSVELNARIAYYDWLRAVAQRAVAEQSVERMRARLEDAKVGFEAGTLAQADVLRFDGLTASAEVMLAESQSFEALAREQLSILMDDDSSDYRVGEDVMAPVADMSNVSSKDELVSEALDQRLEIQALKHSSEKLEYGIKGARAAYYPRIDGFADATYANPNQNFFPLTDEWNANWSVGVSATWKLSAFLNARAQVKELRSSKAVVDANLVSMERAITLEVTAAWHERERALATLSGRQRSAASARAAYDQAVELYRGGGSTATDVIEAEAERLASTLNDINARIDLRVANAKLLRATGRMKPAPEPEGPEPQGRTKKR